MYINNSDCHLFIYCHTKARIAWLPACHNSTAINTLACCWSSSVLPWASCSGRVWTWWRAVRRVKYWRTDSTSYWGAERMTWDLTEWRQLQQRSRDHISFARSSEWLPRDVYTTRHSTVTSAAVRLSQLTQLYVTHAPAHLKSSPPYSPHCCMPTQVHVSRLQAKWMPQKPIRFLLENSSVDVRPQRRRQATWPPYLISVILLNFFELS